MKKYKLGIYRKKWGGRPIQFVYLKKSDKEEYTYELLIRKPFRNKLVKALDMAAGGTLWVSEHFNYSWYEEDFNNKYVFYKKGTADECYELETERLKENNKRSYQKWKEKKKKLR